MEKKKFDYRLLINNLFFTLPVIIVLFKLWETNKFNIIDDIVIFLILIGIIALMNICRVVLGKKIDRFDDLFRLLLIIFISVGLCELFENHETRQFFALGLSITYALGIIFFYLSYVSKWFSTFPKFYKLKEPAIIGYGLYMLLFLLHVWGQVDISVISFLTALSAIAYHLCSEKVRLLIDMHITEIDASIKRLFYISKLFILTLASLSLLSLYLITTSSEKGSIHVILWDIHLKEKEPYSILLSVGYFRLLFVLIMLFLLISV